MRYLSEDDFKYLKYFFSNSVLNFIILFLSAFILIFYVEMWFINLMVEHNIVMSIPFTEKARVLTRVIFVKFVLPCFFVVVSFCLIQRNANKFPSMDFKPAMPLLIVHISLVVLMIGLTNYLTQRLTIFQMNPEMWQAIGIVVLVSMVLTGFFAFVRLDIVRRMILLYKREWIIALIFASLFASTFKYIGKLWMPLSYSIGKIVAFLLGLTFKGVIYEPSTYHLAIKDFGIFIYAPCAGLEGMSIFLTIYLAVLILHFRQAMKKRAIAIGLIGIVMMYFANILRIYLIISLGYIISKYYGYEVAMHLVLTQFHAYVGMILYSIMIMIFMSLTYPFIIRIPPASENR